MGARVCYPVHVVASAAPKARPGEVALLELALPSGAVLRFPVGQGRGCNTLTGGFVVDGETYSNGALTAIDLRFEQHCEGATDPWPDPLAGAVTGRTRAGSTC